MKQILIALLLSVCVVQFGYGQQSSERTPRYGDLRLGGFASAVGTSNAGSIADDWHTSPLVTATGGGTLEMTLDEHSSFDISASYDNRYLNFYEHANTAANVDYLLSYVGVRPRVHFYGVTFGAGFGIPLATTTTGHGGLPSPSVSRDDMLPLYEVRLGGQIPVYQDRVGALELKAEGSYAFNHMLNQSYLDGLSNNWNNGPVASLELGVVYLFNVLERETPQPVPLAER